MHSMHKVVRRIMRAAGTSFSRKAHELWTKEDYAQLINLSVDPRDYRDAHVYMTDAQIVATFRKLEGLPTGVNLQAEAYNSFLKSEERCKQTNSRLARFINWFERGFVGDDIDHKLYVHLLKIRTLIADVLGPLPQDLVPHLSGGSTFYDKGEEITIPHKMSSRPTVTPQAWSVVQNLWQGTAWYRAHDLSPCFVNGNRFTTVPKDSRKDRGICVEPSLNVAYQLALGKHISDRLHRMTGIDIIGRNGAVNAQRLHRALSRRASMDGSLATIDLSNASDTVSLAVVKLLLPSRWFDVFYALRSPYTQVDKKWIKLHKFSSMGNGYTFELETLIFWALAKSVSAGFVSSYGDDIIIPTDDSRSLLALLDLLGFEVNKEKSFVCPHSRFRESCGGDYMDGKAVRPIFLKSIPSSPGEWMILANQVTLIGRHPGFDDREISKAWEICVGNIPKKFRVYGPSWAGDGVIHTEDRSLWQVRNKTLDYSFVDRRSLSHDDIGYQELKVLDTRRKKVSLKDFAPYVQLASALLGTPSSGPVPRDSVTGYKTVWRPTVM